MVTLHPASYEIRPYLPGDEVGIVALQNQAFHRRCTLAQWKWQYRDAPAGKAIVYVLTYNKSVVGHFAIVPYRTRCGNRLITTGAAQGAMVAPRHRMMVARKGLFKDMVHRAFANAFARDYGIVWGTTTRPRDFQHTGFTHAGTIIGLRRDMQPLGIPGGLRASIKERMAVVCECLPDNLRRRLMGGKETVDSCVLTRHPPPRGFEAAEGSGDIALVRDRDFLEWRFARNPFAKCYLLLAGAPIAPKGFLALSRDIGSGEAHLLDYCVNPGCEEVAAHLVEAAFCRLRAWNIRSVLCWFSPGGHATAFCRYAIAQGMTAVFTSIDFVVRANPEVVDPAYAHEITNWSLSMALWEGRRG